MVALRQWDDGSRGAAHAPCVAAGGAAGNAVAPNQPAPKRRVTPRDVGLRMRAVPADTLPLVRPDLLPEHMEHPDTGCAVAPSCLRCPLPRCVEDEPSAHERARIARGQRDREIALIYRRYGAPPELLARTYGVSRRTVFRVLRRAGL